MYTILLHICGIAIIELIFYFEYIGPMESKIFKNAIDDSFRSNDVISSPINIFIPDNISNLVTVQENDATSYLKYLSDDGKNKRNRYNHNLYKKAIFYWIILLVITLFVALIEVVIKYIFYKKKINLQKIDSVSNIAIELVDMRRSDDEIMLTDNISEEIAEEDKFIDYQELKKNFLKNSIYYIVLSSAIIFFEYLFFNYIILKYHIISKEEMEYVIYTTIKPMLDNIIIYK